MSLLDDVKDAADKVVNVVPDVSDVDLPAVPDPSDAAETVVDVVPDVPDVDLPAVPDPSDLSDLLDLSDLPGFDDALGDTDEIAIDLTGDNDITTGGDDDLIVTGQGDDTIDAGDGDNTVYADSIPDDALGGNDVVTTGSGDDRIFTFGNSDVVSSGDGSDEVFTADGDDVIDAGAGNDDVQSGRGLDQVFGGDGDDALRGGEDDDFLDGGAGNDRVIGGSDNDLALGGPGDDLLEGRSGNDDLGGGDGNDTALGGAGNDRLDGGPGADIIDAGPDNDLIVWDALDAGLAGGTGFDILGVGQGVLDLSAAGGAITGIELVDMRGGEASTTVLSASDVLDVSDTDALTVLGDAGDSLCRSRLDRWRDRRRGTADVHPGCRRDDGNAAGPAGRANKPGRRRLRGGSGELRPPPTAACRPGTRHRAPACWPPRPRAGTAAACLADRAREQIALHRVLIDHVERLEPGGAVAQLRAVVDEDPTRAVGRRVERDLDLDPSLGAQDLHALVGYELGRAVEQRLPCGELQQDARQPVGLEVRIVFDLARHPDRLRPNRKRAVTVG